jgi:glycosyltransferase involved in cell wall biosynthesis
VVVPREDADSLAAGIRQVLALPQEARLALGAKGRERIRTEYSLDKFVERMEQVYGALATQGEA